MVIGDHEIKIADSVIRYGADIYVLTRVARPLLIRFLSTVLYSVAVKTGADEIQDHLEKHYGKKSRQSS